MSPRGELQFHFCYETTARRVDKKKNKYRNLTKLRVSFPLQSFINIWKIGQVGTFGLLKKEKETCRLKQTHHLLLSVAAIIPQPRLFMI